MKTRTSIGSAFIVAGMAALIGAGVTFFKPEQVIMQKIGGVVGNISFEQDSQREVGDLDLDFKTAKKLVVDNNVGNIHVVGTSDTQTGKLHFSKGIHGSSSEKLRTILQDCKVEVKQEGDVVMITTRYNASNFSFSTLHVDLEVNMPAGLVLELQNTVGEIDTKGLMNTVTAKSDVGAVRIDGFKGEVRASSKTGKVDVRGGQEIKLIDAYTNVGQLSIRLPENNSLSVDAQTDIGRIRNDFKLPENDRHSVRANIGDGSQGLVRLKTSTGGIDIVKQ